MSGSQAGQLLAISCSAQLARPTVSQIDYPGTCYFFGNPLADKLVGSNRWVHVVDVGIVASDLLGA